MTARINRRYISLPAINKKIPLWAYVRAIKAAKQRPDTEFKTGLTTWWPTTGREIVQQFRRGMHDRISQGISYSERGGSK